MSGDPSIHNTTLRRQTISLLGAFFLTFLVCIGLGSCGGGGGGDSGPVLSPAKDITEFSFTKANNADLATSIVGSVSGSTISVTLPYGQSRSALVATFTSLGVSVKVGAQLQSSGVTVQDFSSPVTRLPRKTARSRPTP